MTAHSERKHSKFSASGAERWFNCPGSVELSEGIPDKTTVWSREGTQAHEVLELEMRSRIEGTTFQVPNGTPRDMVAYTRSAADVIWNVHKSAPGSQVMVETRISLPFIHPDMFGTFDGAVIDTFGTLHVFDYKYGQGHAVSPVRNLQAIFYGIGVAARAHWNFKRAKLWIIQPRIKGYNGPLFWELGIFELMDYVPKFKDAVNRVEREPDTYNEGPWCHWCKAKAKCPLKQQAKLDEARAAFSAMPIQKGN